MAEPIPTVDEVLFGPQRALPATPTPVATPGEGEVSPEPSTAARIAAAAARMGVPIAGGIIGALSPIPGGTYFGASGGGMLGEEIARRIEGTPFDPVETAIAGATGLIPAGKFARVTSTAGRAALRAGQGALEGAAVETARSLGKKGELPSVDDVLGSAALGGALGAGGGALEARGLRKAAVKGAPSPAAPAPPAGALPTVDQVLEGEGSSFVHVPGLHEAQTGNAIPDAAPRPTAKLHRQVERVDELFPHLPDGSRAALKTVIADNADLLEERVRGTQPIERTEALAGELVFDASKMLPKGRALNAEQLAAVGNTVGGLQSKVDRLAAVVAAGNADDHAKLALKVAQQELVTAVASFTGATAEAGRSLRILREARSVLERGDAKLIRRALKIGASADQIAKMLQGAGTDPISRYRALLSVQKPGFRDYARWYFLNSVLSGPRTHERNIIGNAFNAAFRPLTTPVAAGLERVRGVPLEERTVFAGEVPAQVFAAIRGIPTGFKKAAFLLRNGFSLDELEELEVRPPEIPGGLATNLIGRGLGAADQFFRTVAYEMELHGGAFAEAMRQAGGNRAKALPLLEGILRDPSPSLVKQAARAAERATFQEAGGGVTQGLLAIRKAMPGFEYVVPFIKTPANIMKQGVQASPLGFATSLGRESSRLGAQARGEAALGTMLLAPVAMLAWSGKITGSGSSDPAKRDADYAAGWRPNSVRIGDRWVSYNLLQPVALPFSVMANAFEAARDSGGKVSASELPGIVLAKTAKSVLQQSYLSGLFDVLNAIDEPEGFGAGLVRKYAQTAVPYSAAVRTIREGQDPYLRESKGVGEAVGAGLPIQATRALGLPEAPPRLRATGEPATRDGSPFNVLGLSEVKHDPVRDEITRLADAGLMPPLTLPTGGAVNVPGRGKVKLERADDYALRKSKAQNVRAAVERVMREPSYQKATDEAKARRLRRVIDAQREATTRRAKAGVRKGEPLEAYLATIKTGGRIEPREEE